MPIYEFFCTDCNEKYEELCSSLQNSLPCPSCGKEAKKVVSLFRAGSGSSGGGTTSSSCGG